MPKRVLIDCDVGVDDAFALILAFHSPELEVKAVTAVNGNVPLNQVFENIQKVLSLIRPKNNPIIAKGADKPLHGKPLYAHSIHGEDGLGGAKIERKPEDRYWETYPKTAHELIINMVKKYDGELTLIAVGPLTNLALAIKKDLDTLKMLKEIIIMGGAVNTGGNVTPHAEFNIFSDPIAADIVFKSGIPITLVPLDVTHQVNLTPKYMEERLIPIQSPFSKFVTEATGYDLDKHLFRNRELIHLHDPLAVGVAIDPTIVKKERLVISVETREGEFYGKTSITKEGPVIEISLDVDSERFLDLFLSRLS